MFRMHSVLNKMKWSCLLQKLKKKSAVLQTVLAAPSPAASCKYFWYTMLNFIFWDWYQEFILAYIFIAGKITVEVFVLILLYCGPWLWPYSAHGQMKYCVTTHVIKDSLACHMGKWQGLWPASSGEGWDLGVRSGRVQWEARKGNAKR